MTLKIGFVLSIIVLLNACASTPPQPLAIDAHTARSANPASLNCLQNHGKLEIQQTPEGRKPIVYYPAANAVMSGKCSGVIAQRGQ